MAKHHPPFPQETKGELTPHIYALIALESDAAASRLQAAKDAADKAAKYRTTPHNHALWLGYAALRDEAARNFRKARDAGDLLICFHGTRAFLAEGGAA